MGRYHDILHEVWGYTDFRPGQEAVIQSVAEGRDTLALLPTGAGKSLCYQVPALAGEGMTLVISPLIALMKDQVDHLRRRGVQAEAIYSGMPYSQLDRILDNAVLGGIKLLYISPERIHTDLAEARIRRMNLDLIAVDEAHCISQWGYDFRPAYLEIALLREWHPSIPVLALTATAIPEVVEDIQRKLIFQNGRVVRTTFRRPNLSFRVEDGFDREEAMCAWMRDIDGSGIVYVRSRKKTVEYARFLSERGIPARAYHAGLPSEERKDLQEAWQQNKFPVMVATNAFGMGIDKPDVRMVVHMGVPDSLEAYYQEAGRGGRDGQPATAVLLAGDWDLQQLLRQLEESFPPLDQVRQVYRALGSYLQLAYGSGLGESFDFDIGEFCRRFTLKPVPTLSCLKILEESGWITLSESFYQPSTLLFTVSSTELYPHQLKNQRLDIFVKSLLRRYEGLFHNPAIIRESDIATELSTTRGKVVQMLDYLHKAGLCSYRPAKDKPQLTFRQECVDPDCLSFDREMLQFRRKRQEARIEAIREYLTTPECRQLIFMRYFGEMQDEVCGRCDRCQWAADNPQAKARRQALEVRLREQLTRNPDFSVRELRSRFRRDEHAILRQILQHWSNEGLLRETSGKIYLVE